MENNINIDLSKYSNDVIKNIETDNVTKILDYLYKIKCPIIDDIVEDYFDIFTIKYNEFIKKVEYLNNKYNDLYFNLAEKDLNYLEELFIDN